MSPKKKNINSKNNNITWIYRQSPSFIFWFVDVEYLNWVKSYYVFHLNKLNALDWDKVLCKIKTFKGKKEAIIKKILKRTDKILIWEFFSWNTKNGKVTYWFVKLKNNSFHDDIFIPGKFLLEAKNWDVVWIKIIDWKDKKPEGRIINIVWNKNDLLVDVDSAILESWFEKDFSHETEKELDNLSDNINYKELKKRHDLRKVFTFTIDDENAKDLDDAISIKQKENGDYVLFVHVADVSHYVMENSLLDKEALKRWNSVYLVNTTMPMLPTKLSNDLCSLNPDTDKLTLTCEIIFWKNAELKKAKVYESVIRSDFRLTYKEVDEILKDSFALSPPQERKVEFNFHSSKKNAFSLWYLFFWKKITLELINSLKLAKSLRDKISKNKRENWVLSFDFPATKITLDKEMEVSKIETYPRYISNKIIEELMIMANETVSRKFSLYPFLYRVHEMPSADDISKLEWILRFFNIDFKFKHFNTLEFSKLLCLIKNPSLKSKRQTMEKLILRTLSKARYSDENFGHFGLALKSYSHFTSPIRRYADLQIHRIIKQKLNWILDKRKILNYKKILWNISFRCSDSELRAEKLEYKVKNYFIVKHYKNKIWEEFDGVINSILPNIIFVSLSDTAEWSIEIKDFMSYNEDFMRFEDKKNWINFCLWDSIRIRLIEADLARTRLNFELV